MRLSCPLLRISPWLLGRGCRVAECVGRYGRFEDPGTDGVRDSPVMSRPGDRFECDYADHIAALGSLISAYPDMIVWGNYFPWYSFISVRQQAPGVCSRVSPEGYVRG